MDAFLLFGCDEDDWRECAGGSYEYDKDEGSTHL